MRLTTASSLSAAFFSVLLLFRVNEGIVIYDNKTFIINGVRRLLISGSIHYPRSTPEMWKGLIHKAKAGGLDVIETYVFWNGHEPSPGKYVFTGRYDLVRFIKTVQSAGLFVFLRIGPYVCAEWNYGGLPVWLSSVPGISFRTNNEPFKAAMQRFVEKIVKMLQKERLFESQGGPIILSQIENEYGPLETLFGSAGRAYAQWAAEMAISLGTGVPWVMCKQPDAPNTVINSCNGFYCAGFVPNNPQKPSVWTEAWTGWFTEFGGPTYARPVEDLAFAVARFIQKGGSFINYYMYHGGTNFGRTAGGPFITTSYDYDAPIDEYGLRKQPKYDHLRELHRAIKLCEKTIVNTYPKVKHLADNQEVYVFSHAEACAAFLTNLNSVSFASFPFNGRHYKLPPWSISILPDCRSEVFNTASIGVQTAHMQMIPMDSYPLNSWERYSESIFFFGNASLRSMDQVKITRDATDYLWYSTCVDISPLEAALREGSHTTLAIESTGNVLHVFLNGRYADTGHGSRKNRRFRLNTKMFLQEGSNTITLLSNTVGLQYVGGHYERWPTGVLSVVLLGLNDGPKNLTSQKWLYKIGLSGESMNLFSPNDLSSGEWGKMSLRAHNRKPLTWYKTSFNAPTVAEPLAINMSSMGKGQAWINGQNIGRYWTVQANGNCNGYSYAGTYRPSKFELGCGQPSQQLYHMPASWLKPTGNILVIFEEMGGDVTKVHLAKRSIGRVCADVSEFHPTVKNWQLDDYIGREKHHKPKVRLSCTKGNNIISAIKFASYGTPKGSCGNYELGICHSSNSLAVLEKRCVGQERCSVAVATTNFGRDPCQNTTKRLAVEAICSAAT